MSPRRPRTVGSPPFRDRAVLARCQRSAGTSSPACCRSCSPRGLDGAALKGAAGVALARRTPLLSQRSQPREQGPSRPSGAAAGVTRRGRRPPPASQTCSIRSTGTTAGSVPGPRARGPRAQQEGVPAVDPVTHRRPPAAQRGRRGRPRATLVGTSSRSAVGPGPRPRGGRLQAPGRDDDRAADHPLGRAGWRRSGRAGHGDGRQSTAAAGRPGADGGEHAHDAASRAGLSTTAAAEAPRPPGTEPRRQARWDREGKRPGAGWHPRRPGGVTTGPGGEAPAGASGGSRDAPIQE